MKLANKATAPFDTNSLSIGVGYDPENSGRSWNGAIDSVKVLNKALTAEEIAALDSMSETDESVVYAMDFANDKISTIGTNYEDESYWGYGGDKGARFFCSSVKIPSFKTLLFSLNRQETL